MKSLNSSCLALTQESVLPSQFNALVVDDDPFSQKKFRNYLAKCFQQLNVDLADTYESGLRLLNSHRLPNLIIVDLYLGGQKTGIDLIKSLGKLSSPPSLILTSAARLSTIKDQLPSDLENLKFLHKPFHLEDFYSALGMVAFTQN